MIKVKKLIGYNKKFKRQSGWAGADGIYSLNYNGKILMYFSDTFIGESNLKGKRISFELINNSLAISNNDLKDINFIYNTNPIDSIFKPNEGYYWLEDGIIENDNLYIFALKMQNIKFAKIQNYRNNLKIIFYQV